MSDVALLNVKIKDMLITFECAHLQNNGTLELIFNQYFLYIFLYLIIHLKLIVWTHHIAYNMTWKFLNERLLAKAMLCPI